MALICEALTDLKVKYRGPETTPDGVIRLRVGGLDKRKLQFKGWIELEDFENEGVKGSFCIMLRDQVRPSASPSRGYRSNTVQLGQSNFVATALEVNYFIARCRTSCL